MVEVNIAFFKEGSVKSLTILMESKTNKIKIDPYNKQNMLFLKDILRKLVRKKEEKCCYNICCLSITCQTPTLNIFIYILF